MSESSRHDGQGRQYGMELEVSKSDSAKYMVKSKSKARVTHISRCPASITSFSADYGFPRKPKYNVAKD